MTQQIGERGERNLIHSLSTPLTNSLYFLERHLEKALEQSKDLLMAKTELQKVFAFLRNREAENLQRTNFILKKTIKELVQSYCRPYKLKCHLQLNKNKICFYGKENKFVEIMNHLINNAIESYPEIKTDRYISVAVVEARHGVNVIIGDHGRGMNWWQKLLARWRGISFKRVKSGLGLHYAYFLLKKEFGGKLTIISESQRGTMMIVYFPC